MKKIYIHIGFPKTGTSTIQKSLFLNKDKLLENGVLVLSSRGVDRSICAHHNLAWEIMEDRHYRTENLTWGEVISSIKETPADKVIITTEYFNKFEDDQILKIRNFLKNEEIFVIVYIRRQDLHLQSFWSQMIKAGETEDFHLDFNSWINDKETIKKFKMYPEYIERWARIFGKDHMRIRILEKKQMHGVLFHDFLYACDIEKRESFESAPITNTSPGLKTLVLIQNIKKIGIGFKNGFLRWKFYELIQEFCNKNGWDEKKLNLINKDLFDKIMGSFHEGNHKLAREYFGREDLFLETFEDREISRYSIDEFQPEELLDLFAFVIQKMLKEKCLENNEDNLKLKYKKAREELEMIHTSRGWKMLEKLRSIRRKLRI